jgi:cell division septation protein DedD
MSPSLIEEVRILSDDFSRHGQLQIVFVGQLELMDTLKSPGLRQVDQRVCVYSRLEPLAQGDIEGYVSHRLQVAGGHRPMFTPGALALLHQTSLGVPRLLNRLCDRALHEAYLRRSPMVDQELLASVLDAVPQPAPSPTPVIAVPQPAPPLASAIAVPPPPARMTPTFATQVDAWLAEIDRAPASVAAIFPTEETTRADERPTTAPTLTAAVSDERPAKRRPYRYLERIGRRWARAAVLVTAALIGLKVIVTAASYVPAQFTRPTQPAAQAVLPSSPLPDMRPMMLLGAAVSATASTIATEESVIAVAVFATRERTERLLNVLERQGFQAFTRPLVRDGRVLYRVLVGPFDSEQVATADLHRLQLGGGYTDARIMSQ